MQGINKQTMLDLIIDAKRNEPEDVRFSDWLAEYLVDHLPTLTPPNEWVSVDERLPPPKQNVLAYSPESGIAEADYGDGVWMQYRWSAVMRGVTHWMLLPAPPDKGNNVPIKAPNEPLTLEQLRQMDEIPIYVVTEKYGSGWCILNWHGVNKSYTYFSRTGTSEGMTATPLSAKTYGDLWIAYRRPPEGGT